MSDLIDGVFYSSFIQKNVRYRVLVPDGVSESVEPVPVLYVLHGLFGSCENWTDLTALQRYVADAKLLIVMPDGGDNWYTDSEEKYESYLMRDLMPEVESRFGAASERGKRAITGNSMGGYGALKLALKYPETFDLAASFSGAFHVTRLLSDSEDGEMMPSVRRVFGEGGSRIRTDNDIFDIAALLSGSNVDRLPGIYFDCGIDDEFLSANREFSSALSAADIEHEFLEIDGGHDWPYWDDRIRYLVSMLKQRFSL
jgi:putative tributyrin esterase